MSDTQFLASLLVGGVLGAAFGVLVTLIIIIMEH